MTIGLRHRVRELRELGLQGAAFRLGWELRKFRSGGGSVRRPIPPPNWTSDPETALAAALNRTTFAHPRLVAGRFRERMGAEEKERLGRVAMEAAYGRIVCFSRWSADFGNPIDWFRNPVDGGRWPRDVHYLQAMPGGKPDSDIKLIWEVARFPQAYHMARAAALLPERADLLGRAFTGQVESFLESNPCGVGPHWHSSQEVALRIFAWLFGAAAFAQLGGQSATLALRLATALFEAASHIEANLEYAEKAVYNNHLISEALALYIAGSILPTPRAAAWRGRGKALLDSQADRQVYPDGGYIQQSHTYHRFALQLFQMAGVYARSWGERPSEAWDRAAGRSLDFLLSAQDPPSGMLPNYGANDGGQAYLLNACPYPDFRPTLQALSIATRGERIYPPGPWDEEACWLLGPEALDAPLRAPRRESVSFHHAGHHVLRGRENSSFGAFRCGDLRDRFSQIDMLHLDLWWRGHNVLVDGGSYLYNGGEEWHRHFMSTASHNTVQIDGRDQMIHLRRFKVIYPTEAKLLDFQDSDNWIQCSGEHYGYLRYPGKCVHRRSILLCADYLWVVVDRIEGEGTHLVRLHWLGGDFPYRRSLTGEASLRLQTPDGPFHIAVFGTGGWPLSGEIVAGRDTPPRGWLSRHYGERVPVPSLSVESREPLPVTLVTILGAHVPSVTVSGSCWSVVAGGQVAEFEITADGIIQLHPRRRTPAPIVT